MKNKAVKIIAKTRTIVKPHYIGAQRDMLARYVHEQGWKLAGEYIGDGFSGLSFNRPDFKRMIADVEAGKINCVITKDLSRLGRNYLESGAYIEIFFPEHGVRYIAINEENV